MNLVKSNLCKNCTSSNRGQKENYKEQYYGGKGRDGEGGGESYQ